MPVRAQCPCVGRVPGQDWGDVHNASLEGPRVQPLRPGLQGDWAVGTSGVWRSGGHTGDNPQGWKSLGAGMGFYGSGWKMGSCSGGAGV